jgi:hypothetical protein
MRDLSYRMAVADINDRNFPGGIFTQLGLSSNFHTFSHGIRTPSLLTLSFNIHHSPGRVAMTSEYM